MDLDLLVGALTAGSLYALVAMGFNILYRPTNVFNFAQGDLVMLGAMFGATFITLLGLPWFVGAALAMLAVAALALLEEKIAVAPVLQPLGDRSWLGDHHAGRLDDLRQPGRPRLGARPDRGSAARAAQHGDLRGLWRQHQLLPDRRHGDHRGAGAGRRGLLRHAQRQGGAGGGRRSRRGPAARHQPQPAVELVVLPGRRRRGV